LMARPAIDLLVGFGGVVRRKRVAAEADVFIECDSLAPLLPLSVSSSDCERCTNSGYATLLRKGLGLIHEGAVHFREPAMRERIFKAHSETSWHTAS
jgi:hypothetical protein